MQTVFIKKLYIIYIFLLPFMLMIPIIKATKITGINASNSSFIMLVIIMVILFRGRIIINKDTLYPLFMSFMMAGSSLLMATILHKQLGYLWGEDTYRAAVGDMIYYIFIAIGFIFNSYCSTLISLKEVEKILLIITKILILIGYTQILVLFNFPVITSLYSFIANIGMLSPTSFIQGLNKITITGTEPGSSSIFLGVLILPYLFSKIIYGDKRALKYIVILLPIIYFTKSSTMYIVFIFNLIVFLYFLIKEKKVNIGNFYIISIVVVFIMGIFFTNPNIYENINYYLFEKINDTNNQSTAMRLSVVINDIKCFLKYPILGIGNGLQGFYYNTHLPDWIRYSESLEVMGALRGKLKVVSGGPFIAAFISGYGLLGIILLMIYIMKTNRIMKRNKKHINYMYYMYYIGGIAFIVGSLIGFSLIENQIALFLLSIPFMTEIGSKCAKE